MRRLLIDASSIAYWKYFSLQRRPEGQSAAAWLTDFIRDAKPDDVAIVFDGQGNWRNERHADYKAHRPVRPKGVAEQLDELAAMPFPRYRIAGFEADDVIATICNRPPAAQTLIVANDKDLFQLVSSWVLVYDPKRDQTFDNRAVFDKFGVWPDKLRLALAIAGDTSDNLPGVPGFGIARAACVAGVNGWSDVEHAINKKDPNRLAPGVSPVLRELLIQFGERVKLNYELIGLRTDVNLVMGVAA